MGEDKILKAAFVVVKAMDKLADETLPKQIADVVKLHAKGAGAAGLAAGWAPGVGSTIAVTCAAGFVWTMYGRINNKLGVPLAKNVVKSLATALCTNLAAYAVGVIIGSAFVAFIPGFGSTAAAITNGALTFALTWASGLVYLKVLAKLAGRNVDISTLSGEELKAAMKEVVAAEDVKSLLKEAKDSFKKQKDAGEIDDVKVDVDDGDDSGDPEFGTGVDVVSEEVGSLDWKEGSESVEDVGVRCLTKFCSNCGAPVAGGRFCPSCGAKLF